MIEILIRKKVQAISISLNEPKPVEPVIAEGMKQGILMMMFDSDLPISAPLTRQLAGRWARRWPSFSTDKGRSGSLLVGLVRST